jgi:S1-C subfamily serine protease
MFRRLLGVSGVVGALTCLSNTQTLNRVGQQGEDSCFHERIQQRQLFKPLFCHEKEGSSKAQSHYPKPNVALHRYTISDAVEKALPAVVNVNVISSRHSLGPIIFGSSSSGSGFIFTSNSGAGNKTYVLTNAHVVGETTPRMTEVNIALEDGRVLLGLFSLSSLIFTL